MAGPCLTRPCLFYLQLFICGTDRAALRTTGLVITHSNPSFRRLARTGPIKQRQLQPFDFQQAAASDTLQVANRPFFGVMGVAPLPAMGRTSSMPPGVHTGNLDNKDLVAGTTLYLPVYAAGALFSVGDAHAAQGHGRLNDGHRQRGSREAPGLRNGDGSSTRGLRALWENGRNLPLSRCGARES
jgi:Acetamidase/Formamidase family